MKKISIISIIILLGSLLLTSCNDFLDETPDNRAQLDSEEKITSLLVSAYPRNSSAYVLEAASDNMDENVGTKWSNDLLLEAYYNWKTDYESGNDRIENIWGTGYKAVATANHALEAIERMGNPASLNAQKGEALIARAYGHFYLSEVFCLAYGKNSNKDLGIPYADKPETEVNPHYERGTMEQLYERINADIEAALPLINDNLHKVPKYHFNKKAAYAFAARFNLFYRKYDKAIEYANVVLGENPRSVLRDWPALNLLPTGNNNMVSDAYIDVNSPANLLIISTTSAWGARYRGALRYSHNSYISRTETLQSPGPWGTGSNINVKISNFNNNPSTVMRKIEQYWEVLDPIKGTGYAHVLQVLFSTDETLLCRAEAYALKKEYVKAFEDINTFMGVFTKIGSYDFDKVVKYYNDLEYYKPDAPTVKKKLNADFDIEAGTQESLIHCILHLRRIAFVHEGLRFADIKRYGIEIQRRQINGTDDLEGITDQMLKDDPRRALQLPPAVVAAGLQENPR